MRLILSLRSNKTINQKNFEEKYHTAMHGFLYKQLLPHFPNLHEEKSYGVFCFGNLFPIENSLIKEGGTYKVVITSPLPEVIEKLFFSISLEKLVNLGEASFTVLEKKIKIITLKKHSSIENISPIQITIKENEVIKSLKFGDARYLDCLRKNLIRKYNFFSGGSKLDEEFQLFENVIIETYPHKAEASFPIYFYNKEKNDKFYIIGSKLIFHFKGINETQLKAFQTCFDAGFGERTTYGAGFVIERWNK